MVAHRLGLVALALTGCAIAAPARRSNLAPPARESRAGARPARRAGPAFASSLLSPEVARAVETASALVGRRTIVVDGVDYGGGCAALVRAAFDGAGRPLPPEVRDASGLHALASARGALRSGRPEPGEVVFLADRPGGAPAHVGLIASASSDGTAVVLHRAARGVVRLRLNATAPDRLTDARTGKRVNDAVRIAAAPVPAGSLVVGFAALL